MTLHVPPPLILNSFTNEKRSDGRIPQILFGEDLGGCMVILGNTTVSADVDIDLIEPPFIEYIEPLQISVDNADELDIEANQLRNPNEILECQKYLEKCMCNNNCLDLDTLKLFSELKICSIKLMILIYSNEGNLFECASIAAITALLHFKILDTSIMETMKSNKPLPLPITDIPLVINLAVMEDFIIVAPTKVEERSCDSSLIVATNASKEIYFIQCKGVLLSIEEVFAKCKNVIVKRVTEITKLIKRAIFRDMKRRKTMSPEVYSFVDPAGIFDSGDCSSANKCKVIKNEELISTSVHPSVDQTKLVEIEIVQKPDVSANCHSKHNLMISKWGIEEEIGTSSEDEDAFKFKSEMSTSKQKLKYKEALFSGRSLTDIHSQKRYRSKEIILEI